jgi:anti-anti-sigma factor
MLEISLVHERETVARLGLSGQLDAASAPLLDNQIQDLPASVQALLLDLQGLDYLSSAGLRSLLKAHKQFAAESRALALCNLTPFVRQVVEFAGMASLFRIFGDGNQAMQELSCSLDAAANSRESGHKGRTIRFIPSQGTPAWVECWTGRGDSSDTPTGLEQASLAELGFALGRGAFGKNRSQALERLGSFLSCFSVAALLPDAEDMLPPKPDFITTRYPSETVMFVAEAAGLGGDPTARVDIESGSPFDVATLLDDLERELSREPGLPDREKAQGLRGLLLLARDLETEAGRFPAGAVLCLYTPAGESRKLPAGLPRMPWLEAPDWDICALALLLDAWPENRGATPRTALEQACGLERLLSAQVLPASATMLQARAWVFCPVAIHSAQEKRLRIEYVLDPTATSSAPDIPDTPDAWDAIIRRIYAGSPAEGADNSGGGASRVLLSQLHGGYQASTFMVESFDATGRRQLPTVVKLGDAGLIQRELTACNRFVLPYIQNNAAMVMGHAQHGESAGLRYNFVGLEGEDNRLVWLEEHYQTRPVAECIPLFDRIFTRVLKPWYAQPTLDRLDLWTEHDPRRLFPDILDAAQTSLGLSPDSREFDCPELGRQLRNPFHVLRHEFPKHAGTPMLWYKSIVHGDMNMRNVLLDQRENIFIIDFAETRQGNVVSDFARLEPILLLEFTRLNSPDDNNSLARFIETWYAAESYAAVPPLGYAGSDPRVSKAYQLLRRLRWYADTVTLFETDMRPYLLAVLQWTACTVCYRAWEPERKRLGAIMAGILCERLLGE